MRKSILVVAVLSLTLFSNAFGQATGSTRPQPDNKVDTNFDCTSAVTENVVDRIRNAGRCYEQGLRLFESGLFPQAAESFRRALQFDPEYADGYSALGRTYFKLREWQKAIDNFHRAAALSGKLRETNEAVIKKRELEGPQKTSLSPPKASTVEDQSKSTAANQGRSQIKTPAAVSIQTNQHSQTAKIQNKPVQPNNPAPVQIQPAQVTKREPAAKVNPAPVSFGQNNAARLEVKESITQKSTSPKETQSALNLRKVESNAPNGNNGAANSANLKSEAQTAAGPTFAPSKNSEVSPSEQSAVGTRAAMGANLTPVKETVSPAVSTLPPTEEINLTKIYRVGPNDVLDVRLNTPAQQSTLYTVTPAGLLEHPLLIEPMPVAGLTVEEIASKFEDDLRRRAIIEIPKASIGVRDYASHALLVSGHVKEAGTKYLRREAIPLYVVVADAQPSPEAAKVTVVRNESNQIYEIDLNQAAEMNFLVRSGDVVTLSPNTTQFIYIGGEIKLPGEKTFRRGLTLMQTVLAAGGPGPKAKVAEISRDEGKGFLVATRFKLNEIVSGKVIDPVLKPGDRISILR